MGIGVVLDSPCHCQAGVNPVVGDNAPTLPDCGVFSAALLHAEVVRSSDSKRIRDLSLDNKVIKDALAVNVPDEEVVREGCLVGSFPGELCAEGRIFII